MNEENDAVESDESEEVLTDEVASESEDVKTEDAESSPEETADEAEEKSDESDSQESGKLFNEEQQQIFDKRVGKEIAKRKELESKLHELEESLNEVKGKSNPDVIKASESLGVPAVYLNPSESKLLAEYDKWRGIRDFCRNHKEGYVGQGGNDRDINSDEIHLWLEQATDNLVEIAPEAKSVRQSKSKQLADDAALGRKLRLERSQAVKKKDVEAKKIIAGVKPSGGMAASQAKPTGRKMTGEQFKKAGGGEAAVESSFLIWS